MKFLVSDINLFDHGQYVYVFDNDNNTKTGVGIFTLNSLGEIMASYCEAHNITQIKLFGNKDYLNNTVVPDINKYAFHNYKDFNVNIEVVDG